jgi:hypothetical protein
MREYLDKVKKIADPLTPLALAYLWAILLLSLLLGELSSTVLPNHWTWFQFIILTVTATGVSHLVFRAFRGPSLK